MDWSLYNSIVNEFAEIGQQNDFTPLLTYCYMAEPFLADDLHQYVDYAQKQGVAVHLNTNASAMTAEKVDMLLETGFEGKVHISFHGATKETYERITGLVYEESLEHTLYLIDHYNPERICIRGVDDHWGEGEKQQWFEFWQPKGTELEYLPPISRCGSVKRLLKGRAHEGKASRLYGCQYNHPLVEMVILFDGRAVMCCQDMGRELIWGDVAAEGITKVWNGTIRKEAIRKLYSGKTCDSSFLCSRCEQALGATGMVQVLIQEAWQKLKRCSGVKGSAG